MYAFRQLEIDVWNLAAFLKAAIPPTHIGGLYTILILQNATDPKCRRHLVFRDANDFTLQVFWLVDTLVRADINRRVTEHAREKGRDADIRTPVLGHLVHITRHREFGDIEFLELKSPVKCLLWRHRCRYDVAAGHPHFPLEDRARAVVIDTGQTERKTGHIAGSGVVALEKYLVRCRIIRRQVRAYRLSRLR